MRLGTKTRYATRAMLTLAEHYGRGNLSSREIADQQDVSVKYLEQLLATMRSGALVRSARGAQGGHSLARPPAEITLLEIYQRIEGAEGFAPCQGDPSVCQRAGSCATQEVWARMYQATVQVLATTTLADLVARNQEINDKTGCPTASGVGAAEEQSAGSAAL